MLEQPEYLPMSREEMTTLGWEELDVLLVSGDAYLDSHACGIPLLGRWLVAHGFRTGLICQPNWENLSDIMRLGRPRLFAGVSAGSLDSLLAHYTAFRKKRHDDAYTPGGQAGARPNRATLVYSNLLRQAFPGLVLALGGVEASLRRAVHYDFWSNSLRRPLLLDAKADIILYGMAESSIVKLAVLLRDSPDARQNPAHAIAQAAIPGSAYAVPVDRLPAGQALPSFEAIDANPVLLIKTTLSFERQGVNANPRLIQTSGGRGVVFEPPSPPLEAATLDSIYALPFTRRGHPSYLEKIPAEVMLASSVTSHRGCAGGCSFCSLSLHQGRLVQSRSAASLEAEIERLVASPDWQGTISDVGGPSANMWGATCQGQREKCQRESCLFPQRCRFFHPAQKEQVELLRRLKSIPGVKSLRVASGIRFDLANTSDSYVEALAGEFTGGQLKIAPEHVSRRVLDLMRKPSLEEFEKFLVSFTRHSRSCGKEQYLVPYLMTGFPGCGEAEAQELAAWLTRRGWKPQQIQCFIPTPGTLATAMFYAEADSHGRPLEVAKTDAARLKQHQLLFPETPEKSRFRPNQPGLSRRFKPVKTAGIGKSSRPFRGGVTANPIPDESRQTPPGQVAPGRPGKFNREKPSFSQPKAAFPKRGIGKSNRPFRSDAATKPFPDGSRRAPPGPVAPGHPSKFNRGKPSASQPKA
ncbi:MAG: YgiQ family radical SAM protein, partial [Planctomycetota bacterium]|nr:YgiQ family radical SAM protein [Planctomycetota bacterium]